VGPRWHAPRRMQPPLDIGLPAERTSLAWQRTALTLAAYSTLLVHLGEAQPRGVLPGVAGLAAALVLLLAAERRYVSAVRSVEAAASPLDRSLVRSLAVGVVALAAAGLFLLGWQAVAG
jgi:uncharacterized membrane protein YidH (DUF202 family)